MNWKYVFKVFTGCLIFISFSCEKNVMEDSPDPTTCDDYSFSMDIMPIISTICTKCHNGTIQTPDLRNYQGVKSNAQKVKELTSARIMPKEGSLSNAQIEMIRCWVDMGAQNN